MIAKTKSLKIMSWRLEPIKKLIFLVILCLTPCLVVGATAEEWLDWFDKNEDSPKYRDARKAFLIKRGQDRKFAEEVRRLEALKAEERDRAFIGSIGLAVDGYLCDEGNCVNGKGAATNKNGGEYLGGWKNGKRSGQGTHFYVSGDKYIGQWRNGRKNGEGTHYYADGSYYIGLWEDNRRLRGSLNLANGDRYVGQFENGEMTGRGILTLADGGEYRGLFNKGQKHGEGAFRDSLGYEKVGIWENDKYFGTKIEWERELKKRADAEESFDQIYRACLLDRGKDIDLGDRRMKRALSETCNSIARDPSLYDRWKYN